VALRGLSLLAGVATVPMAALAAAELARLARSPRPLAVIGAAAALAAFSPRLLVIAQDARPYALLVFAYALAIYGWLRLANAFRSGAGAPGTVWDWLILGAGTALVLWLHGIGILYAAALLGALLLVAAPSASHRRWLRLALTVGLVVLLYLPCLLILLGRSSDWGSGWLHWNLDALPGNLLDLVSLHRFEEPATPFLARILFPILLFVGIRFLLRTGERGLAGGLLLLLLLPPFGAALVSQLGTPVFLPRTLAGVLVPVYLVSALALAGLPRRPMLAAAAILAAILLVNFAQAVRRPAMEQWGPVAAILKREMGPRDAIWVYPNDVKLPLELALGDGGRIRPIPAPYPALGVAGAHPSGSPAVVAIDEAAARKWASDNEADPRGTIWLVRGGPALFDPDDRILRALAGGRRIGPGRTWDNLDLRPLYPADRR
jgi:hypothetical protein